MVRRLQGDDSHGTIARTFSLEDPIIVPHPRTLELYRNMLTVYYVEERMKTFVKQAKCGFHASTRGHEKIQIGITMLLRPGADWFFTYYREKAIAIGIGMPLENIFLGMLGREGDPNSNGRNMPEHFHRASIVWYRRRRVPGRSISTRSEPRAPFGTAVIRLSTFLPVKAQPARENFSKH